MSEKIIVSKFDKQPEIDQYRETRIEYSETFNSTSKSLKVDTYITFKELYEFAMEVMRDG